MACSPGYDRGRGSDRDRYGGGGGYGRDRRDRDYGREDRYARRRRLPPLLSLFILAGILHLVILVPLLGKTNSWNEDSKESVLPWSWDVLEQRILKFHINHVTIDERHHIHIGNPYKADSTLKWRSPRTRCLIDMFCCWCAVTVQRTGLLADPCRHQAGHDVAPLIINLKGKSVHCPKHVIDIL